MEIEDRSDVSEYQVNKETLEDQCRQLADKIKKAQHLVVFTGAGISTSAKIPDYRGPKGVWTLKSQGKTPTMEITLEQAMPTKCHMALVELQNQSYLKYLVSQNVDGLHRRSGIKPQQISELHGNVYLEVCDDCGTEYLRPFDVGTTSADDVDTSEMSFTEMKHITGRRCKCNGILRDTIIDFGESLPGYPLRQAEHNCKISDLAIVLGSSLTVSPAMYLPTYAKEMVIVNLQKTKYDQQCSLRIFGTTDEVMELVMKNLELTIPQFSEDAMKTTLTYQPADPTARISRKIPRKPAPLVDADKINMNGLGKSYCRIL